MYSVNPRGATPCFPESRLFCGWAILAFLIVNSLFLSGCGTRSLFRVRPNKAESFAFERAELASAFATDQVLPPVPPITPTLKSGQWVALSVREPDGTPIELRRYKVISADRSTIALEIEILPVTHKLPDLYYYELQNFPLTYRVDSTRDELDTILARVRFRSRKTKKEEFDTEETPFKELKDAPRFLHEILWIGFREGELQTGPCSVGRIRSKRCSFFVSRVELPGESTTWEVVSHPAVPITQFLLKKSSSEIQRVIQFGNSGAESNLLRERTVPEYLK